jgi:hypothetical protein
MIFVGVEWKASLAIATASVVATEEPTINPIRVGSWPQRRDSPADMAEDMRKMYLTGENRFQADEMFIPSQYIVMILFNAIGV